MLCRMALLSSSPFILSLILVSHWLSLSLSDWMFQLPNELYLEARLPSGAWPSELEGSQMPGSATNQQLGPIGTGE